MNGTDTEVKPHICILKIDESEHWADNIIARIGKIFGVYLYDANRHVHCCEVTPSYELHPLESQAENLPEDEDEREKLYAYIMDGDAGCSNIMYMHVHTVDGFPEIKSDCLPEGLHGRFSLVDGDDWGETSDEAIETAKEYIRGNSV